MELSDTRSDPAWSAPPAAAPSPAGASAAPSFAAAASLPTEAASPVDQATGPDPWRLLGLPGPLPAARYLVGDLAAQYRLLVRVLADEQTRRLTGVGQDELLQLVTDRLAERVGAGRAGALTDPELFPLAARMEALAGWGVVRAWQDQARTEADFLRNRERYQLTETGAALHRFVTELESGAETTSSAAVLAPPILREALTQVLAALDRDDPQAAGLALAQVQTTLADMARTAAGWQARLADALGGTPEQAKVTKLLETVLGYVEMWGAGVDLDSAEIARLGRDLAGRDSWRALALSRLGADVGDARVAEIAAELRGGVATLLTWFDGPDAQARTLRLQIRDAVAPLLRSHRAFLAVGGTVSRRADLLRLATALEAAPDDRDAWRLWGTATGLFSARHLRHTAPQVHTPAATTAWEAPPVPLARRLRTHGPRALAGRASRMPDTSAARALARAAAARDRLRTAAAEAALAARSGTALSQWGPLARDEAELFLDLLATARAAAPAADGSRIGHSSDGRRRLVVRPVVPPASAVLRVPDGRIAVGDAVVDFHR